MALTNQQLWIAGENRHQDAEAHPRRQRQHGHHGGHGRPHAGIPPAAEHRPARRHRPADPEIPGFYRYAKILKSLATGIQSGAIPVPGRKEAPRQTEPMTDHRQRAAAMDLRMRQLAEEGVPRSAIIARMTGYVVDLGTIWNATTDEQLAALCREYPGFHTYAELMEEAAEAERRKPARPYDDLPALPTPSKSSYRRCSAPPPNWNATTSPCSMPPACRRQRSGSCRSAGFMPNGRPI